MAGAGLAGLRACEELRVLGFDGSITLVGEEATPPYERPPLSKQVLTGVRDASDTVSRSEAHYADLGIELLMGAPASSVDLDRQRVRVDRRTLRFDGLIVATGSAARTLPVPGGESVRILRSIDDARALRHALVQSRHVVIIGAGFIGSEIASRDRKSVV